MSKPKYKLRQQTASENDVEASCLNVVRMRGYFPIRLHAGKFWSWDKQRVITGVPKGTPDYVCVHPRHPGFLLETKREVGGVLSEDQQIQIRNLQLGWRLAVCVTNSPHELSKWINQHEADHGLQVSANIGRLKL